MAKSEEELKSLLMNMIEESKKASLKLNIQKTKIWSNHFMAKMANRWGNMETVADFIFLVSKITADSDYSHEIKTQLLLGRKAMKTLDSILRSRDIT